MTTPLLDLASAREASEPRHRLVVRVRRCPTAPVVAVRGWLRAGVRAEREPGEALVTGRLLAEGTRRRSFERIAQDAEEQGMVLQSFASYEAIGVAVDALAADWERALEWTAELLLEPSLPEDRFLWLRRQATAELQGLLDQPEVRTGRAFLDHLYHPHPYGRSLHGRADDLPHLALENCAEHYRRARRAGGLLVVTGDVDERVVAKRAGELFAALDGPAEPQPEPPAPVGRPESRLDVAAGGHSEQAHLYLGHLTVPRAHPDAIPLQLAAIVLGAGAGLAGRIPERIREKEGLAYSTSVSTTAGAGLDPGRLALYVGTLPEHAEQAERSARDELDRLVTEGILDSELEEARAFLVGRDPLRRETANQWADLLAEAEFYGIPRDNPTWLVETLRALDRQDVERAIGKWIRPSELKVTLGLPG